jgi:hypothetical protein
MLLSSLARIARILRYAERQDFAEVESNVSSVRESNDALSMISRLRAAGVELAARPAFGRNRGSRDASIVAQQAIHQAARLSDNFGVTFRKRAPWTTLLFLAC